MFTQDTIAHLIWNFKNPSDIRMSDAVQALGISDFQLTGEPMTQADWDVSFINRDTTNVTFETVYKKYKELRKEV